MSKVKQKALKELEALYALPKYRRVKTSRLIPGGIYRWIGGEYDDPDLKPESYLSWRTAMKYISDGLPRMFVSRSSITGHHSDAGVFVPLSSDDKAGLVADSTITYYSQNLSNISKIKGENGEKLIWEQMNFFIYNPLSNVDPEYYEPEEGAYYYAWDIINHPKLEYKEPPLLDSTGNNIGIPKNGKLSMVGENISNPTASTRPELTTYPSNRNLNTTPSRDNDYEDCPF